MKPIEKRERLFRHSRPNLRAFEFYDGNDYHKDVKILWVAHNHKPFYGIDSDIDETEFVSKLGEVGAEILVIEDDNKQYKNKGPIGIILIYGDDWKIEPHASFFPWATKKNILRSAVAFFQWARNTRKVGCVLAFVLPEGKNLYDRVCKYGVLHYVGKIVNGDPRGDEYLYSVKGSKGKKR